MTTPDAIAKKIAQDLLEIRAVFFRPEEPFIWASGIKSPVYCDNRLTLTDPQVRGDVEHALAETTPPSPPICWGCPWAMSAPDRRTMAGKTRLRAGWKRAGRWWWWRI